MRERVGYEFYRKSTAYTQMLSEFDDNLYLKYIRAITKYAAGPILDVGSGAARWLKRRGYRIVYYSSSPIERSTPLGRMLDKVSESPAGVFLSGLFLIAKRTADSPRRLSDL